MATYNITSPDGTKYRINAPDGASESDVMAYAQQQLSASKPETTLAQDVVQHGKNAIGGFIRGAGSIGATFARPFETSQENDERRDRIDENMADLVGADPNSWLYKGAKLGGEIAGTAGVGGVLAKGLSAVPAIAKAAPGFIDAVRTSGMTAGNAGMATRMAGGAVTGGASAGLVNPDDSLTGAGIGGALPGVAKLAGKAGSSIGQAFRGGGVSPEVAALAGKAKSLGIDIPADRLVQSKPLDAVASTLNYVPFSGRAATEAKMGTQLNEALSRTFGENSSNVTQALRSAQTKLGGQFDTFLKNNTVNVDDQFMTELAEAANRASRELGTDGASIIGKQVDDILAKAGSGQIDGQAAYNIKKTLDRIGNRNSPEAWYALDLKKSLMDVLNRSVGPDKAQAFGQLRQQYGNMLDLQKIAKNGAEGEISVARLANMRGIKNDQMQDLADIAAQFVKQREGQHGMAQRSLLGGAALWAGGPVGLLGGAAVGRAANATLNSNLAKGLLADGVPNLISDPVAQFGYRSAPLLLGGR